MGIGLTYVSITLSIYPIPSRNFPRFYSTANRGALRFAVLIVDSFRLLEVKFRKNFTSRYSTVNLFGFALMKAMSREILNSKMPLGNNSSFSLITSFSLISYEVLLSSSFTSIFSKLFYFLIQFVFKSPNIFDKIPIYKPGRHKLGTKHY